MKMGRAYLFIETLFVDLFFLLRNKRSSLQMLIAHTINRFRKHFSKLNNRLDHRTLVTSDVTESVNVPVLHF